VRGLGRHCVCIGGRRVRFRANPPLLISARPSQRISAQDTRQPWPPTPRSTRCISSTPAPPSAPSNHNGHPAEKPGLVAEPDGFVNRGSKSPRCFPARSEYSAGCCVDSERRFIFRLFRLMWYPGNGTTWSGAAEVFDASCSFTTAADVFACRITCGRRLRLDAGNRRRLLRFVTLVLIPIGFLSLSSD